MQNKTKFKSYLLKVTAFLITIIAVDLLMGTLLKRLYYSQKYGDDYNTVFAIEKATPQMLILGSSRAVNIFDPCVFKDELNTKTFNAGRAGQSIFYHYAILKAAMKRYTPEIVVLSVDRKDFSVDKTDYDKMSELLPFYQTHPEIRQIAGPGTTIKYDHPHTMGRCHSGRLIVNVQVRDHRPWRVVHLVLPMRVGGK